ncbi:MAG: nuclear transport factor 2 family protein [Chloroflexaceae bacterium]|nr:nuclear transport factor 2 family protein [Chloroflexaceae bacterium]
MSKVVLASNLPDLADSKILLRIESYFEAFNRGDFASVAGLFAATGCLQPPFEPPVERDRLASFLQEQGLEMILEPTEALLTEASEHPGEVMVTGSVRTPWFRVNAAWYFRLNGEAEIDYLRVKLLAAPADLLQLRETLR